MLKRNIIYLYNIKTVKNKNKTRKNKNDVIRCNI